MLNVVKAVTGIVFCIMTLVMLLSKKWGIARENGEKDGDVFMSSKMMIFQNNGMWERWVMDYGMLLYVCYVVIYEKGLCKRDEERYRDL